MNKNKALIIIAVLAGLGLIGAVVLLIIAPDGYEQFGDLFVNLILLLGGFAGLTYAQGKQGESIETIKANTNGTLTRKDDEIAALRAALAEQAPEALALIDSGAVEVVRKD